MPLSLCLLLLLHILSLLAVTHQHPSPSPPPPLGLPTAEQESAYLALESINPDIQWRTLFHDDLCLFSAPHGVVCDLFQEENSSNDTVLAPHITQLSFGTISDYSPNPPCSGDSTFPLSLSSFTHLRKVFFYRCFTRKAVSLPVFGGGFGSDLEEVVFIENPSLSGSLNGRFGNFSGLRRLILTGSNVSGVIPDEISDLSLLEQLTISGNKFLSGDLPLNLGKLKRLKVLDLSNNGLNGTVPESLGEINSLIKLDLSSNHLVGKIPESLKGLKMVEFLDLSYNNFGNYGIPLFLSEMTMLKELYLSGNLLGGAIPEIWRNLKGILRIGLSGMGLVGNIPASIGVFLENATYIGLDNNRLEGTVPEELGSLGQIYELNLQKNQLKGRVPFTAEFAKRAGAKLKLNGNPGLCVDEDVKRCIKGSLRRCNMTEIPHSALVNGGFSTDLGWGLVILSWVFGLFT